MNPYLTKDGKPNETLKYTLDYYGISLDEFKKMSDDEVVGIIKKFSDILNDGRVRKSGKNRSTFPKMKNQWLGESYYPPELNYGDSGSFSRYFSLDAWWEKRFKELPAGVQKTFPFLIVPKASKAEKNRGLGNMPDSKVNDFLESQADYRIDKRHPNGHYKVTARPTKNIHPTVKPIKLFSYLITLGSREGDIILDPFIGSGTTAIAASMLGRRYIGFETEEEYVRIARARLSAVQLQLL